MPDLSEQFWTSRYQKNDIAWDLGVVSPPLKKYINSLTDRSLRILIPGCGHAHEFDYLLHLGFKNVWGIDLSEAPVQSLRQKYPQASERILHGDFFGHTAVYDLIIEQTFFCAISPQKRPLYVEHMASLLSESGRLIGLLFNREFDAGPPFGGSLEEYETLFSSRFQTENRMTPCADSIEPRLGHELFIDLIKH